MDDQASNKGGTHKQKSKHQCLNSLLHNHKDRRMGTDA
jgi:hypothetical protein